IVTTDLGAERGALEAMRWLRLADQPIVVVALAVADPAERSRLADGLAMHLSAIHPRCAAALVGDVAYGLIPVAGTPASGVEGEGRAARIAADFLDRVGDRSRSAIGVGQVASDPAGLPGARACAGPGLRAPRAP